MNAQAVPMLLHAASAGGIDRKVGFGDVALESAVDREFGSRRNLSFPWSEFGCNVYDNSGITTAFQARAQPEPECIDWFHKVRPEDMAAIHALATAKPCNRTSADLLQRCGPAGA